MECIYGPMDHCPFSKAVPQLYGVILGDKMSRMSKSGTGKDVTEKIPERLYAGVYCKQKNYFFTLKICI